MMNTLTVADLYEQYAPSLKARIRYVLGGDDEAAQDVLHDVFVKACRHWDALSDQSTPYAWLYRVATTTAIDARRRRVRRVDSHMAFALDERDDGIDPLQRDPLDIAVQRDEVRRKLALLSTEQQAVLFRAASQPPDAETYNTWRLLRRRWQKERAS